MFLLAELFGWCFQFFCSLFSDGMECVCCSKQTFHFPLCLECRKRMIQKTETIFKNRCKICGKELISEKETCLSCRGNQTLPATDRIFSIFSYRLWYKEIMFKWKNEEIRTLSPFFAYLFYEAIKQIRLNLGFSDINIIPVPPRPGKIKEKGWDQIAEVCKFLRYRYGCKIYPMLSRNSFEQQKKRTKEQRLQKVQNDYSVNPKFNFDGFNADFFCEPVIILDDVKTTGATIEKCASLLKSKGFSKVFALTLFTVD